jgi:deazaflavin-dependent oxidoreductase (nitroreductase family)
MPRTVRFNDYGDVEMPEIIDVPRPTPARGQVLVAMKAAGINPLETSIRTGRMQELFPTTFPAGQGLDLAGQIVELGEGVDGFTVGQDVVGFTENQSSHADFVLIKAANLVAKPANVSWEVAGGLYVVGTTAYAALAAVGVEPGETVVVSGAAGGVGSLAVQLAKHRGATVIGLASPANHEWLVAHGVIPVSYGDGVAERITAAAGGTVDAFIDTFGADYIKLAINLGVAPQRIDTIINFADAARYGTKTDGNSKAATAEVLTELLDLIDRGELEVPIAATYPLADVRDAFRDLERRRTRGKIVLTNHTAPDPANVMVDERDFNQRNIDEFRANGGKVGGQFEGFPLLLLTSTGAHSGQQRINPIAYFDINGKIYVVGSSAGRDRDPSWAFNLRAHPAATVEIGSDPARAVSAHELPAVERDRIYRAVVERAPGFGDYERRTDRVIPIFELTPAGPPTH